VQLAVSSVIAFQFGALRGVAGLSTSPTPKPIQLPFASFTI